MNHKDFIFLKAKTEFNKFRWTTKTSENILFVLRFTAIQCVKLDTKAKQAIYYCSTLKSLSLLLEEQHLMITGLISSSTMWSVFLNFSCSFMTCDTKVFFGKKTLIFLVKFSCCKLCKLNIDTPTKYFTVRETENYRNGFLAFKQCVMEKFGNLKNMLEFLSNLGNTSYSHETTAILKEEVDFLWQDNKNENIIIQNLLEKDNQLLRNKDARNIQYNTDVNINKSNFLSDEALYHVTKILSCLKTLRTTNKQIISN